MTDGSGVPVDLRIKRKRIDVSEDKLPAKKRSRPPETETPLDLTVKSSRSPSQAAPTLPPYNPASLLFNPSAVLYDLFLANINAYCQQQARASPTKPSKSQTNLPRLIREHSTPNKHESYACSCGERYTNVAQLVSHLKITNHHAQSSSTHDEVAKLVRGQDIWLSRDTNPANQILKCLRCSSSFETLPDLTAHMMKTNHFTQLLPSVASSYAHANSKQRPQQAHSPTKPPTRSTCLVCSQQFAREVDLVDHLQRLHQIRYNCTTCGMYFENESLYKEHVLKEMHHRNGKANRNRDYFLHQSRTLPKRSPSEAKPARPSSRSSIDRDVERVAWDLLDRIAPKDEPATVGNALSLLQNFVVKQTTSPNDSSSSNCDDDDDDSNQGLTDIPAPNASKSRENPLASLEKMLAYSTASLELPPPPSSLSPKDNGTKRKKFDKYRLFAKKMLRSTLS